MYIVSLVVAIVVTLANVIVNLCKDAIIVNYGLQGYRSITSATLVLAIVMWIVSIILVVLKISKKKSDVEFTVDKELMERIQRSCSDLDKQSSLYWMSEKECVMDIIDDICYVANYYTEIGNEVKNVSCVELADADDVLHDVIVSMLHSVEQCSRTMRIMGSNDLDSVHKVVTESYSKVHDMKTKAEDFVTSIIKYMGDQDSKNDSAALSHITSFKEVILGELDLADKYI